jgi:hypothetical protein
LEDSSHDAAKSHVDIYRIFRTKFGFDVIAKMSKPTLEQFILDKGGVMNKHYIFYNY